jgi:hypothetical protein
MALSSQKKKPWRYPVFFCPILVCSMIHLEFYIQVSRWLSASVPTDGPQARSTAVRSAIAGARGQLRIFFSLRCGSVLFWNNAATYSTN